MGNLTPGATYVYERVGDTVYAREAGSTDRHEIGYDWAANEPNINHGSSLHDHMMEDKLWGEIRRAAKTNPTLQAALDRAIIIHHLSKQDGNQKD